MAEDGLPGGGVPPTGAGGAAPLIHLPQLAAALQAHVGLRTDELRSASGPMLFSDAAMQELKLRIDGFVTDLVNEAWRIARAYQAEAISPAYVRQAGNYLLPRVRRKWLALAGSLGAMLVGAAMSSLLEFVRGTPETPLRALATAIMGMLGGFLIALQFGRE
jgi:hypothetical protein